MYSKIMIIKTDYIHIHWKIFLSEEDKTEINLKKKCCFLLVSYLDFHNSIHFQILQKNPSAAITNTNIEFIPIHSKNKNGERSAQTSICVIIKSIL